MGDLDTTVSQMTVAVDQLSRGMQGGAGGLREIGSGAADMRAGIDGMRDNVTTMSAYLAPLRTFVDTTPDCRANAICSLVSRVVEPVDSVVHSSGELSQGATKLTSGSSTATTAFAGLPRALESMREVLGQAKAATRDLRGVADSITPQVRQLSDYLQQLDAGFRGSAAGGFYLPGRALSDPRHCLRDQDVRAGRQHGAEHRAGGHDRRDRAAAGHPDRSDFLDAVPGSAVAALVLVAPATCSAAQPAVRRAACPDLS